MNQRTQLMGWAQAFLAVLVFMSISNVIIRYAMVQLNVNPIIFSCVAFCAAALILLIVAGQGILAQETMRSLDTWAYGVILMLSYIVGLLLFTYVTSSEGTMLQKISIVVSLLGSSFFLQRKLTRFQWLGLFLVVIAVWIVIKGVDEASRQPVLFLAITFGIIQAARMFTAELHRPHELAATQRRDPKARIRVIGFVMFVMSLIFTLFTFLLALSQHGVADPFITKLPQLKDFMHPPTIYSGMVMGLFIVAPLRLLEFSSTRIIKAENYAAVAALTFFSTLFWEWITSPLTHLSLASITQRDILAGTIISAGGLIIAFTKMKSQQAEQEVWKEYISYQAQNPRRVKDSHDIVAETLAHFQGDIEKSAQALELPASALQALQADKQNILGFAPDVLSKVGRSFRHTVANHDPLTGLLNRSALTRALQKAVESNSTFYVVFMDLNKFKPVNDTYGHETGDRVLMKIADRLSEFFPDASKIARLGGDEFCALWFGEEQSLSHFQHTIQEIVAQPMILPNTNEHIHVGVSIGIAAYPVDGKTPEALLSAADHAMYGMKRSR